MLYGTGYWGVTEANYLVVAGHFLSALFGAKLWEGEYRSILGWQLPYDLTLRRGDLNLVLVLGGGLQQSLGCIFRILTDKVSMSLPGAPKSKPRDAVCFVRKLLRRAQLASDLK